MTHHPSRVQLAGVLAALAVIAGPVPDRGLEVSLETTDDTLCWEGIDPPVSAAPPSRAQTNSADPCAVTVQLSHRLDAPVQVAFVTVDGTAIAPRDYEPLARAVTIAPGELAVQVPLVVRRDAEPEPGEWFYATISSPSVGRIGVGQVPVTIRDGVPPEHR